MHDKRSAPPPIETRSSTTDSAWRIVQFQDLVRVLVRGAPFAFAVMALAVVAAVLATRAQDPVYRASVAMVASQSPPRFGELDVIVPPVVDPAVYRTAIYDGDILRRALERLEGRELDDVEYDSRSRSVRVAIESQSMSSILRIDVRDSSPEYAARLANAVAEGLVAWDQERARIGLAQGIAALERSIEAIDEELARDGDVGDARRQAITALREERVAELARARAAYSGAVAVALIDPLSPASPPQQAIGPRLVLNTAVAVVLGLVTAYGLLLLVWTSNPRVASRDDLARLGGLPVLAEFARPRRDEVRLSDEGTSWLRTRLDAARPEDRCMIVVIAGLGALGDADGVAIGLAESFARGGIRTLFVDADLREARATSQLGHTGGHATPYDETPVGGARSHAPVSVVVNRDRSFDFLPAAPGISHSVDRLVRLFGEQEAAWRERYGVVVVDAGPILPRADALAVAAYADGVVLCARAGRATRNELIEARTLLDEQGASVFGAVLTDAPRTAATTTPEAPTARSSRRGVTATRRSSTAKRG